MMENRIFRCNKEWFVRTRTKAGGLTRDGDAQGQVKSIGNTQNNVMQLIYNYTDNAAAHELGHWMGLEHTDCYDAKGGVSDNLMRKCRITPDNAPISHSVNREQHNNVQRNIPNRVSTAHGQEDGK